MATPLRAAAMALGVLALSAPLPLNAQTPPVPPPSPAGSSPAGNGMPAVLAPYRTPVIALVQPPAASGSVSAAGSVPQDRPVVVFRFVAGEPDDPLDVRSLLVAVDGVDRTALFQTTAVSGAATWQAWGPLADDVAIARGSLATGLHRVTARICSSRGACGSTEAQLLVVPALVAAAAPATVTDSTRPRLSRRVLGAVLGAARKLLVP